MKTFGWIVAIIALALLGYLVYYVAVGRRGQAAAVAYEVSADSIRAYQERIGQLQARAARFRDEYKNTGTIQKLLVDRQIDLLERRIRDLEVAVEQWKASRNSGLGGDLYTKCALLYGSASGICDALQENSATGK